MKLKKGNTTRTLTDIEMIKIFKANGWEEVKEVKEIKNENNDFKFTSKKGER